MTKARDLANLIAAGNPLTDGAISVSEISDLTASAADLNNVAGINSSVQTQLDAKASATDLSTAIAGLGTASALDVGTGANQVVQLDGSGQLPAVDGSLLTGLQAESEITSNRSYWITDTSQADQILGKYNKLQVVPANTTLTGTWQVASDAEVYVTEATSIDSFGEFLEGDQTISGNHIFYQNLEILDGSTITITGTIEGFGDTPAAGVSTAALTTADVTQLIDGSFVFESFGGS